MIDNKLVFLREPPFLAGFYSPAEGVIVRPLAVAPGAK